MESILLDTMYELPSMKNLEEVIITKEVIDDCSKPILKYCEVKNTDIA